MTIKYAFSLVIFLLLAQKLRSQPNWQEIVLPVFETFSKEINDSIASRRAESEHFRVEINQIMIAKKLNRVQMFGPDDMYINEGMSKLFIRKPQPIQFNYERDKQIERFENLNIQLYHSDRALQRWLELKTALRSNPDREDLSSWSKRYNAMPENLRPRKESISECKKWLSDELVCDLVNTIQQPNPKQAANNLRDFTPELIDGESIIKHPRTPYNWDFPIPTESIFASFPMNGQFAFRRSESIPELGYIVLERNTYKKIHEMKEKGMQIKARWTSMFGDVIYTQAVFQDTRCVFVFNLPKALSSEMIYRLELIGIPNDNQASAAKNMDCWQSFRGTLESPIKELRLIGEILITELYFRTGKYSIEQSRDNLLGTLDWQHGAIIFESDEPFDELEIKGNGYVPPPVDFNIHTEQIDKIKAAMYSEIVPYYLTVPHVEPLETVPLNQLVAAEKDHTIDAPFVLKSALGNPEHYLDLYNHYNKISRLSGGYIEPVFKSALVKDSIVTSEPVPFITKDYFLNRKMVSLPMMRCTLFIGEFKLLSSVIDLEKRQILRRVDERAQFFYSLEKRRALRTGQPFNSNLEQFRGRELENLPPEIKIFLNPVFPDPTDTNIKIDYNRQFPGTTQYTTRYQLKFNSN